MENEGERYGNSDDNLKSGLDLVNDYIYMYM